MSSALYNTSNHMTCGKTARVAWRRGAAAARSYRAREMTPRSCIVLNCVLPCSRSHTRCLASTLYRELDIGGALLNRLMDLQTAILLLLTTFLWAFLSYYQVV